jgi:transcriptional regulator with XRE-family HTH domain
MTQIQSRLSTLHNRLRFARQMAGLEQQQLSDAIGISRPSISNYELGKTDISAQGMIDWAAATGVSLNFLAYGTTKAPEQGSEAVVRPEGFEPPAFCSVVNLSVLLIMIARARA